MSIAEPASSTHRGCQNCGTSLLGDFCYACGQPRKGPIRHMREILSDFVDSLLGLDSKLARTIKPLLFRPGFLPRRYLDGHRASHVGPAKLFLVLGALAFLLLSAALNRAIERAMEQRDVSSTEALDTLARQALYRAGDHVSLDLMQKVLLTDLNAQLANAEDYTTRASLDKAISEVRRHSERQQAWLDARDRAIAEGSPPPIAPGKPKMFINREPWHPLTNPVRVAWLPGMLNECINAVIARVMANLERAGDEGRFERYLQQTLLRSLQGLPQALLVVMPLFALLLKACYWPSGRLYMEHLIVTLFLHAFLYAGLLAVAIMVWISMYYSQPWWVWTTQAFRWIWLFWAACYLWLTLRRVYEESALKTTVKMGVLVGLQAIFVGIASLGWLLIQMDQT